MIVVGSVGPQMLVLGTTVAAVLLVGDSVFALVTGTWGRTLVRRLSGPRADATRWLAGTVHVVLGVSVLATNAPAPRSG